MEIKMMFDFFRIDDLTINGVQGEAYRDALDLAGIGPSPLEQFAILPLIPIQIGDFSFSFTNPSLFMLLTLGLVLLLISFVTKKGGGKSVPNAWQSLVELIHDFVPNLVNEQIGGLSGNVKQKFSPRISVTFTFSLFRNPQGPIAAGKPQLRYVPKIQMWLGALFQSGETKPIFSVSHE
ncbi:ATP synthase subunit a [Dendrobium catenatum]|uniref:F-ATPase protein 6 n=1 Tax=Dendrobium catenatum TaxID=906689 RepID=A0A2I0V824_9ASPA|nr:ATP synthase subunit a [Dendrobium catenatum]